MKQALSMRGISAKFSAKQIQTVLRGLDTADSLVVGSAGGAGAGVEGGGGNLEEASSLYEYHIGQLIQIINEIKRLEVEGWGSSIGDYTREALEARTHVALTDAEQLKATMNKKGMVKKQPSSHNKNSTSTPSRGLVEKSKSATHLTSQRRIRLAQSKIIPSIQESKSADTTNTNTKQPPPPKGKKINLNYKKADPFIATIKSDMYVDSSTLTTTWDMVAGLKDAKRALQEAAILPILRPDLYSGLRSPPRGILLYGPPGTGKTMLVRAVAHESQCILFACSASAMTSKWVGEGEKLVRTLFRMASDVAPR
jgi:spastin